MELSINKYRKKLMGIAALGVLLVHSDAVIEWPGVISALFGYGGIGVYIFVFLSAIGLYNLLKTRDGYLISVFCIAFYIVKAITPLNHFDFVNSVSWSLLAIPIITAASWFLSKVRMRFIDSVLDFFGRYSLEMYLWNIFLIQEIRFFGVIDFLEKYGYTSGYLAYGIVVVGEIVLSIVYEKISSAVILKMKQGKAS